MPSPLELSSIEDRLFSIADPSRASAVRELLRRGLQAEGVHIAEAHEKSSDFGVLSKRDQAG